MGTSRAWDTPAFPFERVDIRDRELWLRPLLAADAFALFRLIDAERERLGRWLPWVEETRTERDSARFIADATEERRRRRSLVLALCLEGTIGPLTAKQEELLRAARDDAERLHALVEEILSAARIEAGALVGRRRAGVRDPRRAGGARVRVRRRRVASHRGELRGRQ